MSKLSTYSAWVVTIAAVAGGLWLLRRGRNSTPTLINDYDMSTNPKLPRGYRNNNPLNIRYSAWNPWRGKVLNNTDGSFEQFENMAYGYRAALYLIRKYIRNGYDTVAKIITRWAPESDGNYTQSYIDHVCEFAGLTPNMKVGANDKDTLLAMARAMSIIENGTKDKDGKDLQREYNLPDMEIIEQGWRLL